MKNKKMIKFWKHFFVLFGQVYLRIRKRQRKSAIIHPEDLNTIE